MPPLKLILVPAPLILWLLWLVLRTALGRLPTRASVTIGLSIVTLVYFLLVVGTGIFWVARQELPVFDWHYLPGYLLLLLTLAHVVLHWRNVAALLRRRAPEGLVAPGRTRFVAGVRWTGYAAAGGACVALVFLLGLRQGSRHITLLTAGGDVRGTDLGQGGQVPVRWVQGDGASLPLAQWYHEGSSFPARNALPGLTLEARPQLYKTYPGEAVPLPASLPLDGPGVLAAYDAWRTGRPLAAQGPLDLAQLSLILFHAQGVSATIQRPNFSYDLRTAPSAGALYPVNVYVSVSAVKGLARGIYYYHPKQAALVRVKDRSESNRIAMACGGAGYFDKAPAVLVLTTTFARTAFKYQERAYRYVAMDTGHAAYNLALAAASQGWLSPMIGRFDDRGLQLVLGLEPATEAPLLVMPLTREKEDKDDPRFRSEAAAPGKGTFVDLIHGGTSLRVAGGKLALPPRAEPPEPPAPGDLALPPPAAGRPFLPVARVRRSERNYLPGPVTLEELSALCAASSGSRGTTDPLLAGTAPLGLYPVVRDVKGLPPGVYRYLPAAHALRLVKAGDFSRTCEAACLRQDFCATANVVFVKTVAWKDLFLPDGDRGYRYANIRAGVVGEGLYLQGTALGLGVCGVGAFQDPDVAALLGVDLQREVPLYVTAVGRR